MSENIEYNKDTNIIKMGKNEYNCDDEIDMSIFARKINNRIKIIEAAEHPSITWNDIVASTNWIEDDLVNAPIFACTWAGDTYGFDILGVDYKSILLMQNDYIRRAI